MSTHILNAVGYGLVWMVFIGFLLGLVMAIIHQSGSVQAKTIFIITIVFSIIAGMGVFLINI